MILHLPSSVNYLSSNLLRFGPDFLLPISKKDYNAWFGVAEAGAIEPHHYGHSFAIHSHNKENNFRPKVR